MAAIKSAKKSSSSAIVKVAKPKVSRPGVHAKTRTSKLKSSKLYKKRNVGQG